MTDGAALTDRVVFAGACDDAGAVTWQPMQPMSRLNRIDETLWIAHIIDPARGGLRFIDMALAQFRCRRASLRAHQRKPHLGEIVDAPFLPITV